MEGTAIEKVGARALVHIAEDVRNVLKLSVHSLVYLLDQGRSRFLISMEKFIVLFLIFTTTDNHSSAFHAKSPNVRFALSRSLVVVPADQLAR